MEICSDEFIKLFNLKGRLACAGCGGTEFRLTPTTIPNTAIEEAIFMICRGCGHMRLELV